MSDLQAFRSLGLDAAVTLQEAYLDQPDPNWAVERSAYQEESRLWITQIQVTTPEGVLTMREESNSQTAWIVEPMIKHPEDVFLIKKYLPVPRLDKESVRKNSRKLGKVAFYAVSFSAIRWDPGSMPVVSMGWKR